MQVLQALADEGMAKEHKLRANLDMIVDQVALTAQWPWHYKVKAVVRAAKMLQAVGGAMDKRGGAGAPAPSP